MVDVGLAPGRPGAAGQAEPVKQRIAKVAQIRRRDGVDAKPEEAEGAALEAVGDLLVAAADLGQIVAVARAPEDSLLFRDRTSGQRVPRAVVKRQQLRLA